MGASDKSGGIHIAVQGQDNHRHRGGSGIGLETAKRLHAEGARVLLNGRDEAKLRAAAAGFGQSDRVAVFSGDIAKPATSLALVQAAEREFGGVDILINNAGILLEEDKSALGITPEIFEKTFQTNTLGPLLVAQAFVPFLKKSQAPRIVNVSSGGGQLADGADGWAPAYCVSKTALNGVTSQLAAALPEFAVNSVCPGWVRTDMGGSNASRSVEEGAAGIVWLAADAPQKETGKFWRDKKVIPW